MEICQRCNGEDVGEGESWCEKCHFQLSSLSNAEWEKDKRRLEEVTEKIRRETIANIIQFEED